jgi:predicted PurR-regulated permease PerM
MMRAMTTSQAARRFFFILLLLTTVMMALVIRTLASALFLAAVLAGVLWPIHRRLTSWVRGRRAISAGLLTVSSIVVLVGPLVGFSAFAVAEATDGLRFVSRTVRSEGVAGLVDRLPPGLRRLANEGLERLPQDPGAGLDKTVQKQVSAQGGKAAAAVGAAVQATGSLLFHAVMMLIAFYFLLVQGDELIAWLDGITPLKKGQTRELLSEFKKVSFAVIMSTVITAAVQAAAALVGYLIARVPNAVFFAGITFFVAFIPAIGAAVVCLAAALLLFVTGHPYMAVFLSIWGVLVVGLVDNLVKPILIKAGMEMRGAVVFFALVGGIGTFGAIGLLIGPLVVALFLALLRMYKRDFKPGHGTETGAAA